MATVLSVLTVLRRGIVLRVRKDSTVGSVRSAPNASSAAIALSGPTVLRRGIVLRVRKDSTGVIVRNGQNISHEAIARPVRKDSPAPTVLPMVTGLNALIVLHRVSALRARKASTVGSVRHGQNISHEATAHSVRNASSVEIARRLQTVAAAHSASSAMIAANVSMRPAHRRRGPRPNLPGVRAWPKPSPSSLPARKA